MADYPYIVDNVIHPVNDDWVVVLRLRDVDENPKNLTGWVFWVTITKDLSWADDEAYVHKSFTSADPTSGEVTLSIPADELTVPGTYYRGIKAKTSSGTRVTLVSGTFELVSVPTKAL